MLLGLVEYQQAGSSQSMKHTIPLRGTPYLPTGFRSGGAYLLKGAMEEFPPTPSNVIQSPFQKPVQRSPDRAIRGS